jgi:hypothetical protein
MEQIEKSKKILKAGKQYKSIKNFFYIPLKVA